MQSIMDKMEKSLKDDGDNGNKSGLGAPKLAESEAPYWKEWTSCACLTDTSL